jgi:DNA-binding response OmpR family regulator
MMNEKPVVLAVDDEEKITELLKAYLDKSGYETLCAKNGKEALSAIEERHPSLVLLDLMLPDIAGEIVCRRVREKSNVPIIMLTAKVDEDSIVKGLAMGADDYITKPFSPKELVARVKAALRRSGMETQAHNNAAILKCGALELDSENQQVKKDGSALALSGEEYKILHLFMTHESRLLTRDDIIDHIKGDDFDGFDRTIDAQIKNIRKKIGDDVHAAGDEKKSSRYIQTVYGLGYRFIGEVQHVGGGGNSQ